MYEQKRKRGRIRKAWENLKPGKFAEYISWAAKSKLRHSLTYELSLNLSCLTEFEVHA